MGLISETPSTSYSPTPSQPSEPPSTVVGYASLFAVALLWGSYAPSLRFLFESPMPPSAGLVNFLQAFIASLFLALSAVTQQKESNAETNAAGTPLGQSKLDSSDELWVVSISESQKFVEAPESRRMPRNALEKLVSDALYWRSESVLSAGAELGVWMCLAFGLELYALEVVPATRASFIMQAQVIVTPILVWLSRVR